MCTASNYKTEDHYFGRNFDYEFSYNERITITPRNYVFNFKKIDSIESHYAIIGIAAGVDSYPLYYDNICPWCGNRLVIRSAKGVTPSHQFWGCSSFPNCRYVKQFENQER